MERIRITRIQVIKLFDGISYDIRLKDGQDIGIITAPNGRGKTTILNFLAFLLDPSYTRFTAIREIPFSRFICTLSNGKSIILKRISVKESKAGKTAAEPALYDDAGQGTAFLRQACDFELSIQPSEEKSVLFSRLLDEAEDRTRTQELQDLLSLAEEGSRAAAGSSRKSPAADVFGLTLKKHLACCGCRMPAVQIRSDRLQPVEIVRESHFRSREYQMADPLEEACRQIARILRDARGQYNAEVSRAKDRLPRMFLENDGRIPAPEALRRKWKAYSEELNRYRAIGLIDAAADFIHEDDIPGCYESKGDFLNTYLDAFRHTTQALKPVYEKLSLFKQIFDERNAATGKTVRCGNNGIELFSGKKPLAVSALSSGEKHDFIMFYHLIFNTEKDSLILIDEPEISLHIEWQESYLDHLIDICRINRLQAILATHSPHIISTHFDFLLDKGEKHEKS